MELDNAESYRVESAYLKAFALTNIDYCFGRVSV